MAKKVRFLFDHPILTQGATGSNLLLPKNHQVEVSTEKWQPKRSARLGSVGVTGSPVNVCIYGSPIRRVWVIYGPHVQLFQLRRPGRRVFRGPLLLPRHQRQDMSGLRSTKKDRTIMILGHSQN